MSDDPHAREAKPLVFLALGANLVVAFSKAIISAITHSSSIFAEAVHSLADSLNQLLLLYGMKRSRKQATSLHPFGYARESYFWAFMVAVLLFTVGGFFSVYRGVQKLMHPETHLAAFGLAYLVLSISIGFEAIAFSKALRMINKRRKHMGLYTFLKHCKEPELLVVFLEDLVAEIGLVIAFLGVGLSQLTGSSLCDAIATIAIGVLLCVMAIFLTLEVRSLLLGERASQLDEYKIRKAIRETNTVEDILNLSTQHLGPDEIMIAMNCKFPDYYNSQEIAQAIDLIGEKIRECLPNAKQIFIEPELARESGN